MTSSWSIPSINTSSISLALNYRCPMTKLKIKEDQLPLLLLIIITADLLGRLVGDLLHRSENELWHYEAYPRDIGNQDEGNPDDDHYGNSRLHNIIE